VALGAVGLTTWMTLGAVFDLQRQLFTDVPFSASPRSGLDWDAAAFAPAREAFRRVTRTAFLAGLLSFFLASLTAAIFTRFLTRPLSVLEGGARRFAAGERGLRLPLPRARDELRTLTEAFNTLMASLERQEAWRRDLVADIAHDLRTPLAVMRSELEAMQDGVVPLDQTSVNRLHGEVLTLSRLVGDLRTLSLVEGRGLPLKLARVSLTPFLARIREGFSVRAAEVGAELCVREVESSLAATFDPDQMARVLSNLVDNALRYAAPGRVELGAAGEPGGGVTLWVRDFGPGLPEGALERIFERFYRGDASRTR